MTEIAQRCRARSNTGTNGACPGAFPNPDTAPLDGLAGLLVLAAGEEGALGAGENVVEGETVSVLLPWDAAVVTVVKLDVVTVLLGG